MTRRFSGSRKKMSMRKLVRRRQAKIRLEKENGKRKQT